MVVGIVGAGQLGRMMALAGIPMGLRFEFLDSNPQAPAASLGKLHVGSINDASALAQLADAVDVMTFEVENIPADVFSAVADKTVLAPSAKALGMAQDRLCEKKLFHKLQIPTARFAPVDSEQDLQEAADDLGFPCVLKTRRMGYDGRGQVFLHSDTELSDAWRKLDSNELLLEEFVDFEQEMSLIAARNRSGATVFYPLTTNTHCNGILHTSQAPSGNTELTAKARHYVHNLLDDLDYCGVLTLELFVTSAGLLANEIAPRVHNSGHWSIEGAATSQFENHLRAILDWPLGSTAVTGHSAMINFLGCLPTPEQSLDIPGLHYHSYDKAARPSRKIGHATIVAEQPDACEQAVQRVLEFYTPAT
ncbi:MAG: 5-(carboxyamino)imidazole ribonucleotide synthase [Gammaproteobacteria bacterium]|nr:5-(carboxyamino)imidazole ribonucleotide synthase [Gammaproteobacteria bacterium]